MVAMFLLYLSFLMVLALWAVRKEIMISDNVNTIIGALIAATILFISSVVTLFVNNPDLVLADIRQSAWISIIGGAVLSFLKDYNAITTRRTINKVTKRGDGGGTV